MSLTSSAALPARSARRPISLRIGLILGVVLLVASAIPAVSDIGFDGSGMDVVVVLLAILMPAMALAAIVLVPFAWSGRRRPSLAFVILQLVSLVPSLPPIVLAVSGQIPVVVLAAVGIGALLTVLSAVLVGRGMGAQR
ncbi:hypothetical protein [Naasia lichenicola]|uniref:Uncharacterized protein n=1 Tax=Naasia lichenicola TaxID=2565933 RepID=A0A4S4FEH2_9MICO|nr:hypothetical protein [Naasia lichenicola]THG28539.1 hypothetical protein E6C64_17140 [Naasia lichenicola]